jgi:hypothetical protein
LEQHVVLHLLTGLIFKIENFLHETRKHAYFQKSIHNVDYDINDDIFSQSPTYLTTRIYRKNVSYEKVILRQEPQSLDLVMLLTSLVWFDPPHRCQNQI